VANAQESPHFCTGKISAFFRGSARRGAHKSADSHTDLSAETIEDQESYRTRIEGIFSARSYVRLQNACCEK
jgi:hypothetical protein